MRRGTILVGAVVAALLLGQGIALAKRIQCETGSECLGTNGHDTLIGTTTGDVMDGRRGDDTLQGLDGADEIFGNRGNDQILGGPVIDDIHGGPGNDRLEGGTDEGDTYYFDANWGRDDIVDSAISEGFDDNTAVFDGDAAAALTVTLTSDSGPAPEASSTAGDTVQWQGDVIDDVLVETPGDDTVTGNAAPNRIDAGDDGLGGSDTVNGGGGDDVIIVRDFVGNDVVDCGDGSDTVFTDTGDTTTNCETLR